MTGQQTLSPLKVFIVAGEPSGDVLAARLMQGLNELIGTREIEFQGIGGPLMVEQGLKSLFPMDELSIMGVAEVLPQIPALLKRIKQTSDAATDFQPDAFITVDAPDFSFRVAKKLEKLSCPKIHYVAPSVWAWREGRAAKIARLYDHVLTLLPFEPPYFEKEGMAASFVGHSIIESGAGEGNGTRFRNAYQINKDAPLLMVLPGSRRSEVNRHLEVFKQTVLQVQKSVPDLQIVIPVVGKSAEIVKEAVAAWPLPVIIVQNPDEKYDAMAACNVALAASGTVGLELALADLPSVIAYRMHPVTTYLARKLVKLKYVNLINILEDSEIVPEHILENCLVERLAPELIQLFTDEFARERQKAGYKAAVQKLKCGDVLPGIKAAEVVLAEITNFRKTTSN